MAVGEEDRRIRRKIEPKSQKTEPATNAQDGEMSGLREYAFFPLAPRKILCTCLGV
jgi:hypothetical protein